MPRITTFEDYAKLMQAGVDTNLQVYEPIYIANIRVHARAVLDKEYDLTDFESGLGHLKGKLKVAFLESCRDEIEEIPNIEAHQVYAPIVKAALAEIAIG